MCKAVNNYKLKYLREGRAEGRAETIREIVSSLLKKNFSHSFIKEITKASEDLIQEIAMSPNAFQDLVP